MHIWYNQMDFCKLRSFERQGKYPDFLGTIFFWDNFDGSKKQKEIKKERKMSSTSIIFCCALLVILCVASGEARFTAGAGRVQMVPPPGTPLGGMNGSGDFILFFRSNLLSLFSLSLFLSLC